MLERFLPDRIDNTLRGHPLAPWLFAPVLAAKTGIAFGMIVNGREAARSADGIPLDTYGAAGAQAVAALLAVWGVSQVALLLPGWVALVRYRAMVPAMFGLLLFEHLARKWILLVKPITRTGTPPGFWINLALVALMIAGLALSLWKHAEART